MKEPPDEDILIDLAAVFRTAYERGRFGRRINYKAPTPGGLSDDDRRWAAEIVGSVLLTSIRCVKRDR